MNTTAALKRRLTPGTPIRVTNHLHPHLCRDTTVSPRTNTRALATYATNNEGVVVTSYTDWPKAHRLTWDPATPDTVHIDHGPGEPFLTITVLPDASTVPDQYRGTPGD